MADRVVRWIARLLSLADDDYRRLMTAMENLRALPRSGSAERQRRYRDRKRGPADPVTRDVTRNGDDPVTRYVTEPVTRYVTQPVFDLDSKSLASKTQTSPAFEVFWSLYPKRVGKGKAFKAWKKANLEPHVAIITTAIQRQMAFLLRDGGQYIPNPATWLNQKRWDDDPPTPLPLSKKTSGNVNSLGAFVEGVDRDQS